MTFNKPPRICRTWGHYLHWFQQYLIKYFQNMMLDIAQFHSSPRDLILSSKKQKYLHIGVIQSCVLYLSFGWTIQNCPFKENVLNLYLKPARNWLWAKRSPKSVKSPSGVAFDTVYWGTGTLLPIPVPCGDDFEKGLENSGGVRNGLLSCRYFRSYLLPGLEQLFPMLTKFSSRLLF